MIFIARRFHFSVEVASFRKMCVKVRVAFSKEGGSLRLRLRWMRVSTNSQKTTKNCRK